MYRNEVHHTSREKSVVLQVRSDTCSVPVLGVVSAELLAACWLGRCCYTA